MLANGITQTTTTAGAGTLVLTPVIGLPQFSQAFNVGDSVDYVLKDGNNTEWGIGTLGTNSLARTTVTATYYNGVYTKNPATPMALSGGLTWVACAFHADTKLTGAVYAPTDSNGNPIVNVVPRTGTLASLMALSGGVGELASATDVDAIVKFNGVAGGAKAFYRTTYMGSTSVDISAALQSGVPANAWTGVAFDEALIDDFGVFQPSFSGVAIPAGATRMQVTASVQWAAGTAGGTIRKIRLETSSGVNPPAGWSTAFAGFSAPYVASAILNSQMTTIKFANATAAFTYYRIGVFHDATAAVNLGTCTATFNFYRT